jgi:hypothetical protein
MRFNKNDRTLLAAIAEHRILTVKQLSTLSQRSCQVIRRRVRDWAREGLIITKTHVYGRGRGRPEDIILLGEKSLALFAEERIPSVNRAGERPEDTSCLDHRLLTNWFRIYLLQIERCIPQISVKYLNQNLPPLFENGNESTLQLERISTDKKSRKFIEFIPDGVFSITYRGAEKKTLLFFLEVDMGTETIASMDRGQKDIRQKILSAYP